MKLEFDPEYFRKLVSNLEGLSSEYIGIQCARAQFNIFENFLGHIEDINALRAEIIRLRKENKRLTETVTHGNGD
jgi:hypothetical protein